MVEWTFGQIILNDYVVDRVLGKGGMGIVYLVHSQTNSRQFAVKRATGMKESDRRNFLAELQTWIDLPEHPNIVPCRFFRTVGNEVLIFAEYVENPTYRRRRAPSYGTTTRQTPEACPIMPSWSSAFPDI